MSRFAAGEFAENELRKDFTPSERVAILQTIERMKQGYRTDLKPLDPGPKDREAAAKAVGFGSGKTAERAMTVVERGVPELVAAMDKGEIAIRPAAVPAPYGRR